VSDLEAITDRIEIETLRGEFTDAVMMNDHDRLASLFTPDGVVRIPDCSSHLNYAIYHDRYQRTGDGWKLTERVYEIRYLDTTPLAGSAPHPIRADDPAACPPRNRIRLSDWRRQRQRASSRRSARPTGA
jgi:hypothetical protein